jgi:hypothetical protein
MITAQMLYGHTRLHQVCEVREDGRIWLGGYSTEHDRYGKQLSQSEIHWTGYFE